METIAEIQEIIAKNLPETTAGIMKEFITKAEETRHALVSAEETIESKDNDIFNLHVKINKLKEQVSEIDDVKKRDKVLIKQEEALRIRERDLKLEIAEIRLANANDRNNKIEQLVEKVFWHPSVSVNTHKYKPQMSDPAPGCVPYECGRISENEITTTIKSKE